MTISRVGEAVRAVLKEFGQEAMEGTLTIEDVIHEVEKILPQAKREKIIVAIEAYGPVGEGDYAWARRSRARRTPGWIQEGGNA